MSSMNRLWVHSLALQREEGEKLCELAHRFNSSTWKTEARGLKFKAGLDYKLAQTLTKRKE